MFAGADFRTFCRVLRRTLFACVLCVLYIIPPVYAEDETWLFSITTTELEENDTFQFKISAAGTFYVDCGDGGTLTSTANDLTGPVNNVWTITKNDATELTFTCTYTNNGGSKTIQFGGAATGYSFYSTVDSLAAISFNMIGDIEDTNVKKISSISGSLGRIFGTVDVSINANVFGQPRFGSTFAYASNMTGTNIPDQNNLGINYALPPTLFDGIEGVPARYMFASTFRGCSGLRGSIPSGLFGNLSGAPADDMFSYTFSGCNRLSGSIPEDLFGNIHGTPATNMFCGTFYGCSGLTGSIPSELFGNLSGAPAKNMFALTFRDCSGLTGSIPSGLFGNLSGAPENNMFTSTFYGCSGLTGTNISDPNNQDMNYALPPGLFGNIIGKPAGSMFDSTFEGCSGLTGSIPSGLFGNITGKPAGAMFAHTFYGCSGLSGSIPSGLFGNLSGAPAGFMFASTFYGCSGLTGSIPSGLFGSLSGAPAIEMFASTFEGCSGLIGSIPSGLFGNLSGAPASYMFTGTFAGCSGLTGSIPSGLFGNLSGDPASYMFSGTFSGCSGLTGSIPSGLFGNLSGAPAELMFNFTFSGCSGLSGEIPSGLFGAITGTPKKMMFGSTFRDCSGLTGAIPEDLFGNLSGPPAELMFVHTFNGCIGLNGFGDKTYVPGSFLSGIEDNTSVSNQATKMFNGTQLAKPCPADTYDVTRAQFNDALKPWCEPCPPDTHSPAGSDGPEDCVAGNILTYNCGIATGDPWSDENLYTAGASVPMPETIDEHCNASDLGRIFTGWICNGNIVPDENNQIVMPGESVTCTAQWDECDNANNYWWNIDNTECVQGHKITLKLVASCLEPQYPIEPTVLYTIPTRGAYLDEERTLLMSKTENPIQLPHVEFIANFDTNAPLNPDNNDIQYSVPEVASVNLNNYQYHCPFTMSPSSYGYNSFGNCFIHNHPVDYLTLSDTDHISGLTPENRNGYLTDDGIYQAEYQNQDQIWWINGCAYTSMPTIISPSLTGYTFDNWCTDIAGTMGCFKGQVPSTIAENTTYYAHWTPKHYTVTYNKGAHVTVNSENYVDAYDSETGEGGATFDAQYTALSFDEAPISEHMSVATGYVFVGWTTDSTPIFDDGVLRNEFTGYEYWKRDSNLNVYAAYQCDTENGYRWNSSGTACVNDYSVTYVADVPSGVTVSGMPDPSTETVSANTEYTLKPLPTATGYVLSKWSCKYTVDDVEQTLTPDANDKITMPPYDVTCTTSISDCDTGYHWTNDSHTACSNTLNLVWDTKGANNDVEVMGNLPESCTYKTGTINLAFPTKTGYDFKGWKVVDWDQSP